MPLVQLGGKKRRTGVRCNTVCLPSGRVHTVTQTKRGVFARTKPPQPVQSGHAYPLFGSGFAGDGSGFKVHGSSVAMLKVYDMLGREIATLVNDNLQPGSYEVTFNAEGLPSGMYLYRLQSGNLVQTRKLLFLR